MNTYKNIEQKWQSRWTKEKTYIPKNMYKKTKGFYNLWMFPYPSAEGVHVGTIFSSTGSDVFGRFMRMNGYEVFQPIGFDSFGIHSENYALKIGEDPKTTLGRTLPHFTNQFKMIAHGYDWTKTVTTSDIEYYKWTQWLFVQLFKAGLAYRKKSSVNWCSSCKTVLADEQVMTPSQAGKAAKDASGKILENRDDLLICERCGTVAEKRELEQWFLRITDYSERLLKNLSKIDWPEKIKIAQKNWIGKKGGINITYPIKDIKDATIAIWTSRPDTNFGATFIVVSPEYAQKNLLKIIPKETQEDIKEYIKMSLSTSHDDRVKEGREKT